MKSRDFLNGVHIASFDVFDTLLIRKVDNPATVFYLVQAQILSSKKYQCYNDIFHDFAVARVSAEKSAREIKVRNGLEPEVTLDEIYEELSARCGLNKECASSIKELELLVESRVLEASSDGKLLYEDMRKRGIEVIFITDMYLPYDFLVKVLSSNGYDVGEGGLYISGCLGVSKASGAIYDFISKERQINHDAWLHVGDNFKVDVENPIKKGIRAYHAKWSKLSGHGLIKGIQSNDVIVGSVVGFLQCKQSKQYVPSCQYEKIGYSIFGPLVMGFIFWLVAKLKEDKIDRIIFFARDAYIFKLIYDKYFFEMTGVESRYMHLSRASVIPLSITEWDREGLRRLFIGRGKRSMRDVFDFFGLDFPDEIECHGFDFVESDIVSEKNIDMVFAYLESRYFDVLESSSLRRVRCKSYFDEFFSGCESPAVVDLGWAGSLQAAVAKIIQNGGSFPCIRGYYVGLLPEADRNRSRYNLMSGWLNSFEGIEDVFKQLRKNGGIEVLENVLSATHGSTISYDISADGPVPVFDGINVSSQGLMRIESLHVGIEKYFSDNDNLFVGVDPGLLVSRAWFYPFFRMMKRPNKYEVEALGDLSHSDLAGRDFSRLLISPRIPLYELIIRPLHYLRVMKLSFWKAGFIVRNFF